jgi:hypothetical protein
MAARAHDKQAIDGPYLQIKDVDGYKRVAGRSAALGLRRQVGAAPRPDRRRERGVLARQEDYDHAELILDAYDYYTSAEGGARAVMLGDEMIDEASRKMAGWSSPPRAGHAAGMRGQVAAPGRCPAQLLGEELGQGVRVLRQGRVLFVDGAVGRQEPSLGEDESRHGLARDVHQPPHLGPDAGLDHVERCHQVVAEDVVRHVLARLGQRGGVHDGLAAPHDVMAGPGVGQVGLDVGRRAGLLALEHRGRPVGGDHLVPARLQAPHDRRPDLAAGAGDENAHAATLERQQPLPFGQTTAPHPCRPYVPCRTPDRPEDAMQVFVDNQLLTLFFCIGVGSPSA